MKWIREVGIQEFQRGHKDSFFCCQGGFRLRQCQTRSQGPSLEDMNREPAGVEKTIDPGQEEPGSIFGRYEQRTCRCIQKTVDPGHEAGLYWEWCTCNVGVDAPDARGMGRELGVWLCAWVLGRLWSAGTGPEDPDPADNTS